MLVAGDLNDFEFSTPLAQLTQGGVLDEPLVRRARRARRTRTSSTATCRRSTTSLVTAGLKSRLTDFRYVHFDNDVYERTPDATAPGISDHDPPLATFERSGASTSTPGDVTGNVPATLALTLGSPATSARSCPGVAADYTATMTATVTSTAGDASLSVLDASTTPRAGWSTARTRSSSRCRPTPTTARSRRCGPTTARSRC